MVDKSTEDTAVKVTKLAWEWYDKPRYPMHDTEPTLRMGKWNLGFVGYDWTSTAPRGNRHVGYVNLPGIKTELGHFGTVKEAKQAVQNAVHYWFYHLIVRGNADTTPVRRVTRVRAVTPTRVRRAPRAG